MGLTKTEVSELYVSIFNRASEKAGNEGWQTQDMTLSQMATEMLDTTASSEYFGDSLNSNLEFIKHIYKNTLNKVYEDDKIGIDGWASQLDAGVMSRGEVVADIVEVIKDYKEGGAKYETADYKTKQAAKQFINRVEVSDYVAENVTYIAKDAQEIESLINSLSFTEDGLSVTDDILTVNSVISSISSIEIASDNPASDMVAPRITSISIADGNYTPNSIVDILVTFDEDILVKNTDSKLKISIGDYSAYASYSSKLSNTITYKYIVEDGISVTQQTLKVDENALVLNNSTITDKSKNTAILTNSLTENIDAIVNDNLAPSITIKSANYTSDTDKLILNGSGFSSILEKNEDSSLNVVSRFDFTKLVWDIDGDYDTTTLTDSSPDVSNVYFTNSDIKLVKVISDTELSILLSPDFTALESAINYGNNFSFGNAIDTLDILTPFVKDTIGNKSTNNAIDNIVIGIDSVFYGDSLSNTITGTSNGDTIYGNEGSDIIYGLSGNDIIKGSSGYDTLVGGLGVDILTGGEGSDTFSFSTKNMDSVVSFDELEGIDTILDLALNGISGDRIDLDIDIENINETVIGSVDKISFISDINSLVNVANSGFNTEIKDDISATIIKIDSGDMLNKEYLAVDLDANNSFTSDDFIIDISGAIIDEFSIGVFL